jgi:hypothetical protein
MPRHLRKLHSSDMHGDTLADESVSGKDKAENCGRREDVTGRQT